MLTGATAGTSDAIDPLTQRVLQQARTVVSSAQAVDSPEQLTDRLREMRPHDSPTVLLIGPAVPNPATMARRLHHHQPTLYIIFALHPEHERKTLQQLSYSVAIGSRWSAERADSDELATVIRNALRLLSQQRRLRTTLDRMNLRLATPAPAYMRDYRRLLVSDRYLASILTHAQDAILSLDQRGVIISWNTGAQRLFGLTERQAIGQPITSLFSDHAAVEDLLKRALHGKSVQRDLRLAAAEGERFLDATFTAFRDDNGQLIAVTAMIRDVSKRVRAETALRESEERLRDILDRAPAVVFIKDRHGRYLFVNAEYLRIVGLTNDRVLGKTDFDLFPEEVARSLRQHDEQVWQTLTPLAVEEPVPQVDGPHTYIAQKFLLRDAAGQPSALCGIASDISDRLRVEQVLRESDRRKDEFLATLAHELRNPLAPIRHAIAIAGIPEVPEEKLKWSREVIERQLQHMARLLDDLLDVSRITRGKLELRKERVYLAAVISTAIETARPLIETKHHRLTVDLPPEPISIDADPIRLAQIFSNLLTNAAKYTDCGGHIRVRAQRTQEQVQVEIIDNGIGIAANALPQLFEMFSQATSALERSEGGLGIGLALVRGLVELHHGTVEAHSAGPGRGSQFIVRLPLSAGDGTLPANSMDPDTHPQALNAASLRIVVADDNIDSLESLAILLELYGHQVHMARTGREALSAAAQTHPSVVILDIGMPEMNGYEAAAQLREQPWASDLLLIALSGWGQEQDKQRAQGAGFDWHFTKPVDIDRLQAVLAQARPARE